MRKDKTFYKLLFIALIGLILSAYSVYSKETNWGGFIIMSIAYVGYLIIQRQKMLSINQKVIAKNQKTILNSINELYKANLIQEESNFTNHPKNLKDLLTTEKDYESLSIMMLKRLLKEAIKREEFEKASIIKNIINTKENPPLEDE